MDAAAHWHIVNVIADDEGAYTVELEREPFVYATASVVVTDRNRREPHGGWDPKLAVTACDDESAREWLEAAEHEYAVAETLEGWQRECARRAS